MKISVHESKDTHQRSSSLVVKAWGQWIVSVGLMFEPGGSTLEIPRPKVGLRVDSGPGVRACRSMGMQVRAQSCLSGFSPLGLGRVAATCYPIGFLDTAGVCVGIAQIIVKKKNYIAILCFHKWSSYLLCFYVLKMCAVDFGRVNNVGLIGLKTF